MSSSTNSTPPPTSASAIGATAYARNAQDLNRFVNDLKALGAQQDLQLPRIAVIGNQSAGKSSLVEAITGITLPRDQGTCTRCPIECQLIRSDEPWKCQIKLRSEHKKQEIDFGPVLTDKNSLEIMIRRAQFAILNPSVQDPLRFLDFDPSTHDSTTPPCGSIRQLPFSSDVVCLEIKAPDITDLTFIDLPGIISNVGDGEDQSSIELIKELVEDYIKQDRTLILLTIPMTDDMNNQSAAQFAKKADPQGQRTIGVLTKPDRLQHGEYQGWLRLLDGTDTGHPLRHGYFVTKQRSPEELKLNTTPDSARKSESEFFTKDPWSGASDEARQRMGISNLTKVLSKLLSALIEKELPRLQQSAKEQLEAARKSLAGLPGPPSSNPLGDLLELVFKFASEVDLYVQATGTTKDLIRDCRKIYYLLKEDIAATCPIFIPCTRRELGNGYAGDWRLPFDKDDDHDQDYFFEDTSSMKMNISQVKKHIEDFLTRELPYNVPYEAKVVLFNRCSSKWAELALKRFAHIVLYAQAKFGALCTARFANHGQLLNDVRQLLALQIEEAMQTTSKGIKRTISLEDPPVSVSDEYFKNIGERYLRNYLEMRNTARPTSPPVYTTGKVSSTRSTVRAVAVVEMSDGCGPATDPLDTALATLARLGYPVKKEELLSKFARDDPHSSELCIMAEVQAYYRIAYKRIIDDIPRIIDHEFLRRISNDLRRAVISGLGLDGADAMKKAQVYLQEDPKITEQRKELHKRVESLEKINIRIAAFLHPARRAL